MNNCFHPLQNSSIILVFLLSRWNLKSHPMPPSRSPIFLQTPYRSTGQACPIATTLCDVISASPVMITTTIIISFTYAFAATRLMFVCVSAFFCSTVSPKHSHVVTSIVVNFFKPFFRVWMFFEKIHLAFHHPKRYV